MAPWAAKIDEISRTLEESREQYREVKQAHRKLEVDYLEASAHTHEHARLHAHTRARMPANVRTRAQTHTHAHTHTHTGDGAEPAARESV